MAIIYPKELRGVTAGALRQLKMQGYTTASGGLWKKDVIQNIAGTSGDLHSYFRKNEPCGKFMEAMTQTKQNIEETREAILAASRAMVDAAQASNKQISDVTGKMRDGSEKLGVAIDKMMKIAGRQDFAETVRLTQSFVDSLERLAALDDRGMLEKVIKAMTSKAA